MFFIILLIVIIAAVLLYNKIIKPELSRQEAVTRICAICEKEFHAAYPRSTDAGQEFCPECEKNYYLDKLKDKELRQMTPADVELYCECIRASERGSDNFIQEEDFFDKRILVDTRNGYVQFKNCFYTYRTNDVFAIVYDLVLREGVVTGILYFHFLNPFFPVQIVKVKFSPKGFGKKKKMQNTFDELSQLSASLGGAPLLTPKEFKKYRYNLFDDAMEDFFHETSDDGDEIPSVSVSGDAPPINFFAGCQDVASAQKRRRDLSKLYHPDAQSGDDSVIKVINNQYDEFVRTHQ